MIVTVKMAQNVTLRTAQKPVIKSVKDGFFQLY